MTGDWIKMRCGFETSSRMFAIAETTRRDAAELALTLMRLAMWFRTHGKHGVLRHPSVVIDSFSEVPGLAGAMKSVGWLKEENGCLMLCGYTDVSSIRKSLGRKVRAQVLQSGRCAICDTDGDLVVDHKTPISRGGTAEVENLQALCRSCNAKKGRQTMEEFTNDR